MRIKERLNSIEKSLSKKPDPDPKKERPTFIFKPTDSEMRAVVQGEYKPFSDDDVVEWDLSLVSDEVLDEMEKLLKEEVKEEN